MIAALASGWALRARRFSLARIASAAQVAALVVGWALAMRPYLVYPDFTIASSAAPDTTLRFVLVTAPFGMALLIPSLILLYRVFNLRPVEDRAS